MKSEKRQNIIAYLCLGILLISLLPIFMVGRYNHPTGDDYFYGVQPHLVWEQTHSLEKTMAEAVKQTGADYSRWQGTYSALFLMYLQPTVFSENAYKFVTLGILTLLVGSIFYFTRQICKFMLKTEKKEWVMIASLLSFLVVQTVPSQGETFFWYNGSMYYTGFFALTLFFLGWLCKYLYNPKKRYVVLLSVSAVFLGGGNYITILLTLMILVMVLAFCIWKKRRTEAISIGIVLVVMLAGFTVSALAPGNALRQAGMWKASPITAVILSLLQGIRYFDAWMGKEWLMTAVILTPIFQMIIKRLNYTFRYPLLVLGFLYGLFCAMSCPTFYSMHTTGPARVVAIVYYGFVLISFIGYFYLLGWLNTKIKWTIEEKTVKCTLFCLLVGLLVMVSYSGKIQKWTTYKAVKLLASGEAAAYEAQYQERLKVLRDDSILEVEFEEFSVKPDMLFVGDIGSNKDEELNMRIAQFYHKNSVAVKACN